MNSHDEDRKMTPGQLKELIGINVNAIPDFLFDEAELMLETSCGKKTLCTAVRKAMLDTLHNLQSRLELLKCAMHIKVSGCDKFSFRNYSHWFERHIFSTLRMSEYFGKYVAHNLPDVELRFCEFNKIFGAKDRISTKDIFDALGECKSVDLWYVFSYCTVSGKSTARSIFYVHDDNNQSCFVVAYYRSGLGYNIERLPINSNCTIGGLDYLKYFIVSR